MLDSKSRAYNPDAAKMLLESMAQKDSASASMIYSKAQEMQARAQFDEVQGKLSMMTDPRMRVETTLDAIAAGFDTTTGADVHNRIAQIRLALNSGDERAVQVLLDELKTYMATRGQATPDGGDLNLSG